MAARKITVSFRVDGLKFWAYGEEKFEAGEHHDVKLAPDVAAALAAAAGANVGVTILKSENLPEDAVESNEASQRFNDAVEQLRQAADRAVAQGGDPEQIAKVLQTGIVEVRKDPELAAALAPELDAMIPPDPEPEGE